MGVPYRPTSWLLVFLIVLHAYAPGVKSKALAPCTPNVPVPTPMSDGYSRIFLSLALRLKRLKTRSTRYAMQRHSSATLKTFNLTLINIKDINLSDIKDIYYHLISEFVKF